MTQNVSIPTVDDSFPVEHSWKWATWSHWVFDPFIFSFHIAASSAVKCITCATPYLKDNWYMTGLPQRPSKFHADCNVKDSLTGDKANLANLESVDCPSDSFCFSLVFQVPDVTDTTNGKWILRGEENWLPVLTRLVIGVSNVVQAVRGCHKTLAQVDNTPMPTNRKSKCDYSLTERKISSSGDLVAKLNTRMDFCNAADNCNFNYIATNDNCNEDSPVTSEFQVTAC